MMRGAWGGVLLMLASGAAGAAGPERGRPLEATLRTSAGQERSLSAWRGKPVIVFYEDKGALEVNQAFKDALFARARARGLLGAAHVVAVANLRAFDFFPARPIALAFVRDAERKAGIPILVDLRGTLSRAPWHLPARASNVVLLDAQGAVVWAHSGRLEAGEQADFFRQLERLVQAPAVDAALEAGAAAAGRAGTTGGDVR